MAITRDSRHKRRNTGGRRHVHIKKRKYECGRPAAMTKIGDKRIRLVRSRGGNTKFRALRLDEGNFSWGAEVCTRKTRIVDVVYNASNNELVRTKTLVKNAIVQVDATPFRKWFEAHYHTSVDGKEDDNQATDKAVKRRAAAKGRVPQALLDQFSTGRLLACISSRPGQCGRADGYILEGAELDFYLKQLNKKKGGKNKA